MILSLLMLVAVGCATVGLVQLWGRRNSTTTIMSIIALVVLGISGFTAETWYHWLGYSRGDSQVFIGYFLIGLFALGAAALTLVAGLIVLAVRPRTVGGHA